MELHHRRRSDDNLYPPAGNGFPGGERAPWSSLLHSLERAGALLHEEEDLYQRLVDGAPDGIFLLDEQGRIEYSNQALVALLGSTLARLSGHLLSDHLQGGDAVEKLQNSLARVAEGRREKIDLPFQRADGTLFWGLLSLSPVLDHKRRVCGVVGLLSDISRRKEAETETLHRAYTDPLTGLPNRLLLQDRLGQAIVQARRDRTRVAVAVVDCDGFKKINDTFGHAAGDALLRTMSQRMQLELRRSDTIARIGGDEFVVIFSAIKDVSDARQSVGKLLDASSSPVTWRRHELPCALSVGVALFPDDGSDVETLLHHADLAMYRAKQEGGQTWRFFGPTISPPSDEPPVLVERLRQALAGDELELHFQPQIDLRQNRVIVLEALLRWRHPEHGLLASEQFLPLATEGGLGSAIGDWVLRSACRTAKGWQRPGQPPLRVAINLSNREFRSPKFFSFLVQVVREEGLDPAILEFELPEETLAGDTDITRRRLQELHDLGVVLSIDDFGSGCSSLGQLHELPLDRLKIPRRFVAEIGVGESPGPARAVIALGRALGIEVVAAGVESRLQVESLRQHDCHQMQGFYFSRPLAPAELPPLLDQRARGRGWH